MWGMRVIVPGKLQSKVLKCIHQNHPGITRMKSIAHSYFWWSGLDQGIEALAKSCSVCQTLQATPPAAPLHPEEGLTAENVRYQGLTEDIVTYLTKCTIYGTV